MAIILKYNETEFRFFVKGSITISYASVASKFKLTAVYDDDSPAHRELFKPLAFPEISLLTDNGELLLTGVILGTAPVASAEKRATVITGYSKPGVLQDCKIPVSLYPLEYNGLSLLEIAQRLAEPFGITVKAVNDNGIASEAIPEITAQPGDSISKFLDNAASQRNLLLTHDEYGELIFTRANTDLQSIATYRESIPAVTISMPVDGQKMHSELTSMKQADLFNDNASEETVSNALIPVFRPTTVSQTTGTDVTAIEVAKNMRANELRGIGLNITSDRWEWLNNYEGNEAQVVKPNNVIDVISPENYLPDRTKFFVEQVTLEFDEKQEIAKLQCVLPEVYNNENPVIVFR